MLNLLGSVYSGAKLPPWQEPFRHAFGHSVRIKTTGGRTINGRLLAPSEMPRYRKQKSISRALTLDTKNGGIYRVRVKNVLTVEVVL